MSHETSGDTSLVYYCNMANTPSGDPQESDDYFFVNTRLALNPDGNGFKGVKEINYIEDLTESCKKLKEAKGLLDDEDDTPEDDSEDLVDVDDELEEGATEVAIFHRKPKSIEEMKKAEANGITVNKSNYKVIGHKELSPEEFDDFAKHLSDGKYSWLQDMYNKVSKSDTGMFNCIEVTKAGDSSTSLLVDPNGYDYARFAAIKEDLAQTPEENIEEEPIEEPAVEEKE